MRLTEDHKPELEREKARIEANGGQVDFQRCWRVICPAQENRKASGLAVSRSLGDLDFKEPLRCLSSLIPQTSRLSTCTFLAHSRSTHLVLNPLDFICNLRVP